MYKLKPTWTIVPQGVDAWPLMPTDITKSTLAYEYTIPSRANLYFGLGFGIGVYMYYNAFVTDPSNTVVRKISFFKYFIVLFYVCYFIYLFIFRVIK
jgi:hypothetical protein